MMFTCTAESTRHGEEEIESGELSNICARHRENATPEKSPDVPENRSGKRTETTTTTTTTTTTPTKITTITTITARLMLIV